MTETYALERLDLKGGCRLSLEERSWCLIRFDCYSKVPWSEWLKSNTNLSVLEAESLEIRVSARSGSGKNPFFWLPASHYVLTRWKSQGSFLGLVYKDFPGGSVMKNLPAMQETWVQSLPGSRRSLEKGMATNSSILAWRIPWTEEPGRLQSMGSQRVKHNWGTNTFTFFPFIWVSPSRPSHLSKAPCPKTSPCGLDFKRQILGVGHVLTLTHT